MRGREGRALIGAGVVSAVAVALVVALPLGAHVERDPVFVDPAPDRSVLPAAGGRFVQGRALRTPDELAAAFRTAAETAYAGEVGARDRATLHARYARLSEAQQAEARGLVDRLAAASANPDAAALGLTDPRRTAEETLVVCRPDSRSRLEASLAEASDLDAEEKARLRAVNETFAGMCRFGEIQPAVEAADNGDTVVVMPGFYTEPTSRAQPHNDPRCADLYEQGTRSRPAPTFAYHVKCPNDLNLVAVIGRDLEGSCIRCNLHIVGSGARPEDVLVEGAAAATDPGVTGDLFEDRKGIVDTAKEVGLRFERTDGAYVGNMTVRNFSEHGFYSIETDGMTFDRVKAYYAHEYGHLSFVTDHLTVARGDFAGSGDAGIYPGASPRSGARLNSHIRENRSHHNGIGLSGTMGSSLLIERNEFDNNGSGITLDSIARAGHPGFPQNNTVIRENRIHSNNFDTYSDAAWVRSTTQAPVGVGIVIAGGNENTIERNWIYDNWRWGTALITVPDVLTNDDRRDRTEDARLSTSHGNRYMDNRMGFAPDGAPAPNGIDFWWDEHGERNCWERNAGRDGAAVKGDPATLPGCAQFPNIGTGNPVKTAYLVRCNFAARGDAEMCDWYGVPPRPRG